MIKYFLWAIYGIWNIKLSKLQDHLESEATEWIEPYVKEFYKVNDFSELTKEQIDELEKVADDENSDYYVSKYWEM